MGSHIDPPLLQELVGNHIHHCFPLADRMTGLVLEVTHTHQCSALASQCSDRNSLELEVTHIPLPFLVHDRLELQVGGRKAVAYGNLV